MLPRSRAAKERKTYKGVSYKNANRVCSLVDLQGISGLGVKKLEAYGEQALRVYNGAD